MYQNNIAFDINNTAPFAYYYIIKSTCEAQML